ncbi:MAG: hypothetical protein ACYSUQ_06730 [Planctomycetota bacterium]|jgi:hypothetical protein
MPQSSSLYPSMIALAAPAAAAVVLTALRPRLPPDVRESRRLFLVVGLTISAQVLHFVEELLTELYIEFPTTFGFPAAEQSVFVGANLTALAVWVAALLAVRQGIVIALLPLWFLGFAELLNLFLHPYMALRAGGYYSGVVTAPLAGVLGIMTIGELVRVTARSETHNRQAAREPS